MDKNRAQRGEIVNRLVQEYGSEKTPYFDYEREKKDWEKESEISILLKDLEVAQSRNIDQEIQIYDDEIMTPSQINKMKRELLEDKQNEINDLRARLRSEINKEMEITNEEGKKELKEIKELYSL